jgi:hypothetical protein
MMKIQDYIHYYIGCRLEKESTALTHPRLMGVCENEMFVSEYDFTTPNCDKIFTRPALKHSISFGKPILRNLQSMTEDEMIGLLQSMLPKDMEEKPTPEDYSIEMFYWDNATMVDGDIAVGANYTCICYDGQIAITICGTIRNTDEAGELQKDVNIPKAYHYLLSNHFDLFGLINAGLAIDAETLNPTTNDH